MVLDIGNNGQGFTPAPFGQFGDSDRLAKDLTGYDEKIIEDKDKRRISLRKSFLTLTNFMDSNESNAYAATMHKCMKNGMWDEMEELIMRCMARVSVKGERANQIVDILTQIQLFKDEQQGKRSRKSAEPPGKEPA